MELFHLYPNPDWDKTINYWEPWHNKLFGVIVAATDETEARKLAQTQAGNETFYYNQDYSVRTDLDIWLDPTQTTCVPLATPDEPGVVIIDFMRA